MKRIISIILSIIMIMCVFTSAMPSFALSYDNFIYEITDEKIVITGYTGTAAEITVPAEINGVSVVAVGEGAFKDNTVITSVTVSSGVEDIGASAFENCTSLITISLPDTIIHIGERAIYNTGYYNDTANWKLKRTSTSSGGVSVGGGTQDTVSWEDIAAPVLQYLYLGTNLIEIEFSGSYRIKSGTRVIADGAFVGSISGMIIKLPTSIVTVGASAFYGCESLKTVENLNLVQYIGDNAFEGCVSLNEFALADNVSVNANAFYNTGLYNNPENWENGVLYNGTYLICTAENNFEAVIRDGTTHIIGEALADKDAIIPASVINIAENAFTNKENVRIFGYSGSYAQQYAENNNNNITFIALDALEMGDVDFNGVVNRADYEVLCSVSSAQAYQSYAILLVGDFTEDGVIDGFDALVLDLILNNMEPSKIKGDADGNGVVNEADYELLVKISGANARITDNYMFNRCDVNEDGAVDGFDAIYVDLLLNGYAPFVYN